MGAPGPRFKGVDGSGARGCPEQRGRDVATVADELVQLVPEQQQAFHAYFFLGATSDSQDWRTFSDQFL